MNNLGEILLITLICAICSGTATYIYRVKKVTRKDFKQSDYAKTKRPDITIGL